MAYETLTEDGKSTEVATTKETPAANANQPAADKSDELVIADPNLGALASMVKNVYGDDKKFETAVKEKLGKYTVTDPNSKIGTKAAEEKKPAADNPPAAKDTTDTPAADADKGAKKDDTGAKKLPFGKPAAAPASTEPYLSKEADEKLLKVIQTKFGDGIKSVQQFMENMAPDWRKAVTKADELETKYKNIAEKIDSLPEPVVKAIIAYHRNDLTEFHTLLKTATTYVDYAKPLNDQIKLAAQTLLPEINITDEKADDYVNIENPVTALDKKTRSMLERTFNKEKSAFQQSIKDNEERQAKISEKTTKRVTASLNELTESLPDDYQHKTAHLKDVQRILSTDGGLEMLFLDKDGVPVKDVAKRILFALHPDEVLAPYQQEIDRLQGLLNDTIASGVGKKQDAALNKRQFVDAGGESLVEEMSKNIGPKKSHFDTDRAA